MFLWAVSMFVCLASTSHTPAASFACVRTAYAGVREMIDGGLRRSPTLVRLATELCRTDVIAYVEEPLVMRHDLAGTCELIVSTPLARFVRIRLNRLALNGIDRIAILSHELEHAIQIGLAPWVRQPADLARLQRVLSPSGGHDKHADRAEADARRDMFSSARAWPPPR
jgi:hypothetical protein